jgi:hypothetical protein
MNDPKTDTSNTTPEPGKSPHVLHPATRDLLAFFRWDHLPGHLQIVSRGFAHQAMDIARRSSNAEGTVALRKLLESKDAAVRAVLPPWRGTDAELFEKLEG